MKHAVYVYEHQRAPHCGHLTGRRRYAFGDHGGWKSKVIALMWKGLEIVARGFEEGAAVLHLAPPRVTP